MKVETRVVGPIGENCYLVEDCGELIVVDPGDELERIMSGIARRPVKKIVLTHGHWDHIGAAAGLSAKTGARIAAGREDAHAVETCEKECVRSSPYGLPAVGELLADGDSVNVGFVSFRVIATPGHTPGSICLYSAAQKALFAGDTLFAGGRYGRTDLAGGSFEAICESMREKLAGIPDDVNVYCGHGEPTTMGAERALNPYLARG